MYLLGFLILVVLILLFISTRKTNQLLQHIIEGNEKDREIYIQSQKIQQNKKQQIIEQAKMRKEKLNKKKKKTS